MSVPFFFQPDYSIHYFFVVFVCWLVLIRPATKRPRAVDERTTVVPPRRSRERKKRLFNLVVCFPFFVLGFHRPSEQFPEGTKKKRWRNLNSGGHVSLVAFRVSFFLCVLIFCVFLGNNSHLTGHGNIRPLSFVIKVTVQGRPPEFVPFVRLIVAETTTVPVQNVTNAKQSKQTKQNGLEPSRDAPWTNHHHSFSCARFQGKNDGNCLISTLPLQNKC